jgi:predicted MPP superfamily phosphohydrolase
VIPSRYGEKFAYGHVREKCDLIVSGGLGCSIMPFRLGVPPEIVLVTLGGKPPAVS